MIENHTHLKYYELSSGAGWRLSGGQTGYIFQKRRLALSGCFWVEVGVPIQAVGEHVNPLRPAWPLGHTADDTCPPLTDLSPFALASDSLVLSSVWSTTPAFERTPTLTPSTSALGLTSPRVEPRPAGFERLAFLRWAGASSAPFAQPLPQPRVERQPAPPSAHRSPDESRTLSTSFTRLSQSWMMKPVVVESKKAGGEFPEWTLKLSLAGIAARCQRPALTLSFFVDGSGGFLE